MLITSIVSYQELQKQIQHHRMYMNQGDTVQIEAPDFDPNIDGDSPPHADEKPNEVTIQGRILPTIAEVTELDEKSRYTPATNTAQSIYHETNWPDAIPVQILRMSSLTVHPEEQGPNRRQAQYYMENFEVPKLEENLEEEQFADLRFFSGTSQYISSQ